MILGAGSGIGRATCQVLSREGATVIAADKNYEAALETIKTHTVLSSQSNGWVIISYYVIGHVMND